MVEVPKKLKEWDAKLQLEKNNYGTEIKKMQVDEKYYEGTRELRGNPNTGKASKKLATNVRNIGYELIESQVDSAIPAPRVVPRHKEDDELAKKIERMLENKIETCGLSTLNDSEERVVPVIGGTFLYVQWDANLGMHSEVGDLKVSEIHPKKLIPQSGVMNIDEMDYFFIQELMTKKMVKMVYNVDVETEENTESELLNEVGGSNSKDVVTVNTAFYRNSKGGIGCFIWCGYQILLDIEEYQARQLDHCAKCDAIMVGGTCPKCGGKKVKKMPVDYEELVSAIEVRVDGSNKRKIDPYKETTEPMLDEAGNPILDEQGQPKVTVKKTQKKIPYYKPNMYPVVLRKNITKQNRLLGGSDIDVIIDQQDTIKALGSNMNEKLLKGGSYVTLPEGTKVDLSDENLKVLRLRNPADKAMIDVLNVQAPIQQDMSYLETNYQWAKSTLGITDSYQGKYDASATSGTAKQYAINQAAGRLESKRTMKNNAYARLYELMFKFWLAYADQPTEYTYTDSEGQVIHEELSRKDFLKIDKAGEFYWDDEFIFKTDPTSTLMQNREALWNQTDMKLQSGAFGPLGDLETARTYWTMMKANGYPNAAKTLSIIEQRINEQKGALNEMPALPNGNEDPGDQNGTEGWETVPEDVPGMPEQGMYQL